MAHYEVDPQLVAMRDSCKRQIEGVSGPVGRISDVADYLEQETRRGFANRPSGDQLVRKASVMSSSASRAKRELDDALRWIRAIKVKVLVPDEDDQKGRR